MTRRGRSVSRTPRSPTDSSDSYEGQSAGGRAVTGRNRGRASRESGLPAAAEDSTTLKRPRSPTTTTTRGNGAAPGTIAETGPNAYGSADGDAYKKLKTSTAPGSSLDLPASYPPAPPHPAAAGGGASVPTGPRALGGRAGVDALHATAGGPSSAATPPLAVPSSYPPLDTPLSYPYPYPHALPHPHAHSHSHPHPNALPIVPGTGSSGVKVQITTSISSRVGAGTGTGGGGGSRPGFVPIGAPRDTPPVPSLNPSAPPRTEASAGHAIGTGAGTRPHPLRGDVKRFFPGDDDDSSTSGGNPSRSTSRERERERERERDRDRDQDRARDHKRDQDRDGDRDRDRDSGRFSYARNGEGRASSHAGVDRERNRWDRMDVDRAEERGYDRDRGRESDSRGGWISRGAAAGGGRLFDDETRDSRSAVPPAREGRAGPPPVSSSSSSSRFRPAVQNGTTAATTVNAPSSETSLTGKRASYERPTGPASDVVTSANSVAPVAQRKWGAGGGAAAESTSNASVRAADSGSRPAPPPPPPPPPPPQPQEEEVAVRTPVAEPAGDSRVPTPITAPPAPTELYERIVQVGEGTYGKVYKARNVETGGLVALKRIRMEAERDGFPVTAVREIKLLQSLRHPNVVELVEMLVAKGGCFPPSCPGLRVPEGRFPGMLHDTERDDVAGQVYMVLEYVDHDLTGVLQHPTITFTPAHLKSLMQQFLEGLGFIHRRGVLHRDLKGSNILLSKRGELKIADFGLARFYQRGRQNDYTNRVITQWYKPPELLFGATVYDERVDMWSAGCVLPSELLGLDSEGTDIRARIGSGASSSSSLSADLCSPAKTRSTS